MSYNKETGMYEGFIYLITNKVNGKQYVGQTRSTIEERWRNHKSNANVKHKQKFALHLAMNKYGIDNFTIQAIEQITQSTTEDLLNELNNREIYYIKELSTLSPNGYNLTQGGDSGNNNDFKAVTQYDFNGNIIAHYESIVSAANMTNGNAKAISACCKHHLLTSGGYVWEYKGNEPRIASKRQYNTYKVDQYTLDGEFIATYDSAYLAGKTVNASSGNIRNVCLGYLKTVKGFVWRRHGEPFNKYFSKSKVRFINEVINQYDFCGNLICVYDEYTPFPDYVIIPDVVYSCCRGNVKYAYGYIWTFGDNKPDLTKIPDSQKIVYQYNFNGEFIKEYKNIYIASEETNTPFSSILNCIQGRNGCANGYRWTNKYYKKLPLYIVKQAKSVDKYDYNGNFIMRYNSIKEAIKDSIIIKNKSSIGNCCKGRIEYTNDGVWRYADEPFDKFSLHKFCIVDQDNKIVYSSILQKDLATYLDIDFRIVSANLKNQLSYNGLYFKIIDINAK